MDKCPLCGNAAEADPEHRRMRHCLTCWHSWAVRQPVVCGGTGTRNVLAPWLRLMGGGR